MHLFEMGPHLKQDKLGALHWNCFGIYYNPAKVTKELI